MQAKGETGPAAGWRRKGAFRYYPRPLRNTVQPDVKVREGYMLLLVIFSAYAIHKEGSGLPSAAA